MISRNERIRLLREAEENCFCGCTGTKFDGKNSLIWTIILLAVAGLVLAFPLFPPAATLVFPLILSFVPRDSVNATRLEFKIGLSGYRYTYLDDVRNVSSSYPGLGASDSILATTDLLQTQLPDSDPVSSVAAVVKPMLGIASHSRLLIALAAGFTAILFVWMCLILCLACYRAKRDRRPPKATDRVAVFQPENNMERNFTLGLSFVSNIEPSYQIRILTRTGGIGRYFHRCDSSRDNIVSDDHGYLHASFLVIFRHAC